YKGCYFKNGEVFYATDRKITHGLINQGHFVYDFSYRDQAKAQRVLAFKKRSIEKMNNDLMEALQKYSTGFTTSCKSRIYFSYYIKNN
ncbi:MAG: hypothetical protein U5K55_01525, partial [Aliarcobacter sp.]|nr:hypothetical protein [Aliarcobacter sp.]